MNQDPATINEWFWRTHYGLLPQQLSRHETLQFAKAVLIITGADGGISETERQYYTGLGTTLVADASVVEELRQFDWRNTSLEECLRGFKDGVPARSMLYDAILVASSDGYSPEERAAIARAAEILGVDASVVRVLETLVEMEQSLRQARAALFMPEVPDRRFK